MSTPEDTSPEERVGGQGSSTNPLPDERAAGGPGASPAATTPADEPRWAGRLEDRLERASARAERRFERASDRARRRAERRTMRWGGGGGWIAGLILILLGLLFLAQNFGLPVLRNWWALFILIPGAGSLSTAWNLYQTTGELNQAARGALIGGGVLVVVALTFLFDLNWGVIGPLLLIAGGAALLLTVVRR